MIFAKRTLPIFPFALTIVFIAGILLGARINVPVQPPPVSQTQTKTKTQDQELLEGEYQVVRILDGDTIELSGGRHIRYYGIDAPELRERWGEAATRLNRSLVLDKQVRVQPSRARDPYGRTIADVWTGKTLVAEALVREGYAQVKIIRGEAKSVTLPRLQAAELEAKESRRGLWFTE